MHHIATIVFPTEPPPTVPELMAILRREAPDVRVNEAEDGFEISFDSGIIFAEVDAPALEALDGDDDRLAGGPPQRVTTIASPDPPSSDELRPGRASSGDGVERFERAAMLLHLEGDFEDPADVIGLLEVLVGAAPDAAAKGAGGEPIPLPKRHNG